MIAAVEDSNAQKKQKNIELTQENEQLKQQLSAIANLKIDREKYAPFLLKGKGEGEETGEDEKLNGTLLGGVLTNETYAKLSYLAQANDADTFKDELNNEVTVGDYKKTFERQYGSSLEKTLEDIDGIIASKEKKEDANTTVELGVKGNPNGFNNSLSKLRGEFRSGNSKFDGYLDRKIGDVLSRERLTQDK